MKNRGLSPAGRRLIRFRDFPYQSAACPCTFELGGLVPVLVFEDSDPVQAAESVAINKYRNVGQICISPSRFFVHEAVHDQFVTRFTELRPNAAS